MTILLRHDAPVTSFAETKLRELAVKLSEEGEQVPGDLATEIATLRRSIHGFQEAWSHSQMGYQANVYYKNFQRPPVGAVFNSVWGFTTALIGESTRGEWQEYRSDQVFFAIMEDAEHPDLTQFEELATKAFATFRKSKSEFDSIVAQLLKISPDQFVVNMNAKSNSASFEEPTVENATRIQMQPSTVVIRDARANTGRAVPATHQQILARVVVATSAFKLCTDLSEMCTNLADHLQNIEGMQISSPRQATGSRIFIGHGHSEDWKVIRDYLKDGLNLDCDEFNRLPTAGRTTVARLEAMLEDAYFAIIVMTGEDETADGEIRARENVVHEAGLYQGRLGFENAILVAEKQIAIFSNIDGLGRIDYEPGNVKSVLGELAATLMERGFITRISPK